MRFPWRRQRKASGDGVRIAEAERKYSERKLHEAQPLLETLREMRRRNHVGDIIDELIARRARGKEYYG